MDSRDVPDPDSDFVERLLIRWGLLGFIAGLGVVYVALYALWQALGRYFFGA